MIPLRLLSLMLYRLHRRGWAEISWMRPIAARMLSMSARHLMVEETRAGVARDGRGRSREGQRRPLIAQHVLMLLMLHQRHLLLLATMTLLLQATSFLTWPPGGTGSMITAAESGSFRVPSFESCKK